MGLFNNGPSGPVSVNDLFQVTDSDPVIIAGHIHAGIQSGSINEEEVGEALVASQFEPIGPFGSKQITQGHYELEDVISALSLSGAWKDEKKLSCALGVDITKMLQNGAKTNKDLGMLGRVAARRFR